MSEDKEADFQEARLDNLIWHCNKKDAEIKQLNDKVKQLHTDNYKLSGDLDAIRRRLIDHKRMMATVETLAFVITERNQ